MPAAPDSPSLFAGQEPGSAPTGGTDVRPGRRERNKARTRDALQAAARELFVTYGFAQTTVQQIADAADVSERTFFRYFESKEDLLLPDLVGFFDAITAALLRRPPAEPPLAAVREAVQAALLTVGPGNLITTGPAVHDQTSPIDHRLIRAFITWEGHLADALTERATAAEPAADPATTRLHADVTARVAISVLRAATITARTRLAAGQATLADMPAILQQAFAIAETGCAQATPATSRRLTAARVSRSGSPAKPDL